MLRNYLKIALRTLWKQKGITTINVLGLAAGMAVCLLVGLLFWDQITHDDFHPEANRIYRVTTLMADDTAPTALTPAPLVPALRENVTGVEQATRMRALHRTLVHANQGYNVEGLYAEPAFFDLFGFELMTGNAKQALASPHTAVLTQALARRLFGEKDPVGKTVRLQDGQPLTVTGVVNRSAYRSHLDFDVLVSLSTLRQARPTALTNWDGQFRYATYLRTGKGQNPASIESSLERLRRQHLLSSESETNSAAAARPQVKHFQLEPLSSIPFSGTHDRIETGTMPGQLGFGLGVLAFLVLPAAGFNYVNLSTARSLTRGREVGVRKTMGAHRQQVMGQLMTEAVIVALLALGGAVVVLQGLVPAFNRLPSVRRLGIEIGLDPGLRFYGMAVLFATGIGILAGLYPAWHLSTFQPAQVLKIGRQAQAPGFQWMTPRKGLIVLQFLIAFVVLVTGTVLYRQFRHVKTGPYPLRMDHVVRVELQESDYGPFQQAARRQSEIREVGGASSIPVIEQGSGCRVESAQLDERVRVPCFSMDYESTQLLDLPIVQTEDFTEARFESGRTVIVTAAGARHLGFSSPQQALGQPVTLQVRPDEQRQVRIAGIMQNVSSRFQTASKNHAVFHYAPDQFQVALARTAPGRDSSAVEQLRATWNEVAVDPFRGSFLRSYLAKKIAPLVEMGGILGFVAVLAVLIGCLGLLGIVTYAVQTRTREIGIRKALGATASSIVGLLSKNVLWLIGTAILVGMPIAWVLNRLILRNFPNSINFGPGTLLVVALGLLGLAVLAVAPPTLRAAQTDPATTLRDE